MLRVPVSHLEEGEMVLDAKASRYVARVHRARAGDRVLLFDPTASREAEATVIAVERTGVRCKVESVRKASVRAERQVTLLQAIGKGDKFDDVVRDATALGATRLIAVETARSVVKLGARGEERRLRWERVAAEAARQCGRGDVPEVLGPMALSGALSSSQRVDGGAEELKICLWEQATEPLGPMLRALQAGAPLTLFIGPEGGLEPAEVAAAVANGFVTASLGPRILRTEIAATAVLGAVVLLGA